MLASCRVNLTPALLYWISWAYRLDFQSVDRMRLIVSDITVSTLRSLTLPS